MSITETVLEMHYHRPLMDLFRETYGVGSSGRMNFYKYSPQREVFLGFDQAYAMTELNDQEFFGQLQFCAMNDGYRLSSRFLAYFLQFKVVSELQKIQKKTPAQIRSRPHYRSSLETRKNDRTGFSQHELLFNLNRNDGAMVYYACPMVFEKASLYEIEVNLDLLRFVDVDSCPSIYADNSKHYIYFDDQQSQPVWCSDPVDGVALSSTEFSKRVIGQILQGSPKDSAKNLMELLMKIKKLGESEEKMPIFGESKSKGISLFADSLMIMRLDEETT